jgi:hypothetical protein
MKYFRFFAISAIDVDFLGVQNVNAFIPYFVFFESICEDL